jgi:stage III sporulation protein AG
MNGFLRKLTSKEGENQNKKKIENLVFLIIILIVTIIIINAIWKKDENSNNTTKDTNSLSGKILADNSKNEVSNQTELETKLENILSTIKNVGKVNVLINYSESSSLVPLYNESTTTSSTEEGDSGGGTRNVTETESKKDVVFSESSGQKQPVTEKTVMPTIQGAIITAEGAKDANVKTNIINAVGAVTGLSIDKIQVFETNN